MLFFLCKLKNILYKIIDLLLLFFFSLFHGIVQSKLFFSFDSHHFLFQFAVDFGVINNCIELRHYLINNLLV